MSNLIQLKNSTQAGHTPGSLLQGEVAINISDKSVWVGDDSSNAVLLLNNSLQVKGHYRGTVAAGVLTKVSGTGLAVSRTAAGTFTVSSASMEVDDILLIDVFENRVAQTTAPAAANREVKVFNFNMMALQETDPAAIQFLLVGSV